MNTIYSFSRIICYKSSNHIIKSIFKFLTLSIKIYTNNSTIFFNKFNRFVSISVNSSPVEKIYKLFNKLLTIIYFSTIFFNNNKSIRFKHITCKFFFGSSASKVFNNFFSVIMIFFIQSSYRGIRIVRIKLKQMFTIFFYSSNNTILVCNKNSIDCTTHIYKFLQKCILKLLENRMFFINITIRSS